MRIARPGPNDGRNRTGAGALRPLRAMPQAPTAYRCGATTHSPPPGVTRHRGSRQDRRSPRRSLHRVGSSISAVRRHRRRILMLALRTGHAPFVMHPALRESWRMQEFASNPFGTARPGGWQEGTARFDLRARPCGSDGPDSAVAELSNVSGEGCRASSSASATDGRRHSGRATQRAGPLRYRSDRSCPSLVGLDSTSGVGETTIG